MRGVRLVRVERAVIDAMRWACDVREAVVELEKVLAAELTSREEVATYLATVRGMHGQAQVKDALLLARENSRSPQETRLRLIAELDAGLPPLAVNAWIHALDGRCLGEADLLDEGAGLVIEFDGADHRGKKRQSRDAVKDDDLRDRDVEVMRVTGEQLDDVGRLVARIHAARRRAKFVAPAQRRWIVRRRPEDLHVRLLRARQEAAVLERMERIGGQWPPPAADGLPNA